MTSKEIAELKQHFNEPMMDDLRRLSHVLKGGHFADIRVRHRGEDEWFEADWLKHVVPDLLAKLEQEESEEA